MERKCCRCGDKKPLEEFVISKYKKYGRDYICRKCQRLKMNSEKYKEKAKERRRLKSEKWRSKNITKSRRIETKSRLKMRFGLTYEQYLIMLREQKGACAICGCAETGTYQNRTKLLAVDHCHALNVIRGLLCNKCNVGLGMFSDRPDLLASAIVYLAKSKAKISKKIG